MKVSAKYAVLFLAGWALALPAAADEIRLKDGKKLYGAIVAYEDNMFKVKTDFGYVLVEKDKIAAIIPTTPAQPKPEAKPAAKKEAAPETKPVEAAAKEETTPKAEPAVASASEAKAEAKPAKATETTPRGKREKSAAKEVKPGPAVGPRAATPVAAGASAASVPTGATAPAAAIAPAPTTTAGAEAPPAPPKAPEPPANREEIQGNLYINHTHGFRMYKAPGWNLLEDARQALPHAIVAMGTSDETTLLVVGREKLKTSETLDAAATEVEQKLSEVYENYRRLSEKKTEVSGLHAKEIRYRGTADGRDWSGRLVTVARGNEVFTVLGMTYADSDLIQIQENVIGRAITSLDFSTH